MEKIETIKSIIMFRYHHVGLYFDMNGDTFAPDAYYHLKHDKDMRGNWTEILFNSNWHPNKNKGFMKVWIDGKMKIDYTGVANAKIGNQLNLRYGIYSSSLDRYRRAFNETKHKKRVIYSIYSLYNFCLGISIMAFSAFHKYK